MMRFQEKIQCMFRMCPFNSRRGDPLGVGWVREGWGESRCCAVPHETGDAVVDGWWWARKRAQRSAKAVPGRATVPIVAILPIYASLRR